MRSMSSFLKKKARMATVQNVVKKISKAVIPNHCMPSADWSRYLYMMQS